MKHTILRRMCSIGLTAALTLSLCMTASAFQYPSAYWPLHSAWDKALEAQSPDQVISVAQQTYDLLMQMDICQDICDNLEPKCSKASWCCEMNGDLDGAITWLERQRVFAQWLDENKHSYQDTLLSIEYRMEYLKAAKETAIYALTDQPGVNLSGSGAPVSGTLLGSAVNGSRSNESAILTYIDFQDGYSVEYWIDYYKRTFPKFAQTVSSSSGVLELAWNLHPESTAGVETVLNSDSYIAEGVRALGGLNCTVLLRVGAEMNNWSDCDSTKFIQAFQKVATQAKQYANIKMVFSPDNVSNRNVTFEQFYPGDQYVDWIGVSTYHNTNYAGEVSSYTFDAKAYGNDAYYGTGIYDSDPLVILRSLVRFAEQHGKPMMISECGFSYHNNSTGADQVDFAKDQLNKFYSYVNMIYPQVKAVFYFDNDVAGAPYNYALENCSSQAAVYQSAIANNGAYLTAGQTSGKTWKPLDQAAQPSGTVKLATYVSFPGSSPASVTYYVDGQAVATSNQVPFYYELDTATLSAGKHTIRAEAKGGAFSNATKTYEITVGGGASTPASGTSSGTSTSSGIDSASNWAKPHMTRAQENKLLTPRTSANFQSQITRLQFAELAVNLIEQVTGKEITPSAQSFSDTSDPVVLKAVAAGVTSGTGNGQFSPDNKITRQEMCVMLCKVADYVDSAKGTKTLTNTSTEIAASFHDAARIAGWAKGSVARMTNNDLMSGKDGGVAPLDNAKIEEAVVLILKLYDKM